MKLSILLTTSAIAISASATTTITTTLKVSTPPISQCSVTATTVHPPKILGPDTTVVATASAYCACADGIVASITTKVNEGTVYSICAAAPSPTVDSRPVTVKGNNINRLISMVEAAAHTLHDLKQSTVKDAAHTTTYAAALKATTMKADRHTATLAHTTNTAMATTTSKGKAASIDTLRAAAVAIVAFAGLLAVLI